MSQFPSSPGAGGQQPGHGKAVASLVLGIIALVATWFYVGLILGIVGIVLALGARKEGFVGGMATAGLVLSIIAVALSALWTVCAIMVCSIALPFM